MARDLDPNDPQEEWSTIGAEHWTDYDRAMPYGDFDVTISAGAPVETEQMHYLEGFGLPAQQTVSTGATRYLHGDLLDSTVLMTDDSGAAVASVAYTAFGEVIGTPPATRYQYAGGWGYETGGFGDDPGLLVLNGAPGTAPIILQHVGFRWYDPSIGRFIQRDPIGIFGGLNVYAYMGNDALSAAEPFGLCAYGDDGWVNVGKYGRRYRRGGRFAKPPWWWRAGGWGLRRFPVYWLGKKVAQAGHYVTGQPWEDPEDVAAETVYWFGVYCVKELTRPPLPPKPSAPPPPRPPCPP
ncbi:MAG TPA: RHS repeat-associated core domain-containing protein [Phycisphaerae bacterium]|nr:RHS repeat-associated core domain-containing protein [Phycisphaerae bacterium]